MQPATSHLSAREQRFEHWRRTVGLFAGPAVFALVWWLPLASLEPRAHRLAAIAALVVTWWITEPVPIPATALVGAALMVVSGVAPAAAAFAPFASPTIFLFIGSFMIAEALAVHGLDRRVAARLLAVPWVGRSPLRVRLAFGALAGGLSMWMSNTATAAMLLPVATGVLAGGAAGTTANASKGLLLTLAYACSIGGVGTPVGTPPNLIAIGMLDNLTSRRIDFFRWMAVGVPVSLAMFGSLTLLARWLFPVGPARPAAVASAAGAPGASDGNGAIPTAARAAPAAAAASEPWTRAHTNCLVAFATAVVLWVAPGAIALLAGPSSGLYRLTSGRLDEGAVAILAAGLLFVLPVDWRRRQFTLHWSQAARIDWGTVLLFGGGLAIGHQMFDTGLAARIGHGLVQASGATSLWTITAVMTIVAVLTTEVTSNTAATNMLVPVAVAVAQAAGVSAAPPAMGVALGASLAYMLPISTPPNAIVYGTGRVPITDMIRCGLLLDVLSVAAVLVALRVLCPLLGLV
jgi:sodium-dependent dicarboxylate transporter 2/3/5